MAQEYTIITEKLPDPRDKAVSLDGGNIFSPAAVYASTHSIKPQAQTIKPFYNEQGEIIGYEDTIRQQSIGLRSSRKGGRQTLSSQELQRAESVRAAESALTARLQAEEYKRQQIEQARLQAEAARQQDIENALRAKQERASSGAVWGASDPSKLKNLSLDTAEDKQYKDQLKNEGILQRAGDKSLSWIQQKSEKIPMLYGYGEVAGGFISGAAETGKSLIHPVKTVKGTAVSGFYLVTKPKATMEALSAQAQEFVNKKGEGFVFGAVGGNLAAWHGFGKASSYGIKKGILAYRKAELGYTAKIIEQEIQAVEKSGKDVNKLFEAYEGISSKKGGKIPAQKFKSIEYDAASSSYKLVSRATKPTKSSIPIDKATSFSSKFKTVKEEIAVIKSWREAESASSNLLKPQSVSKATASRFNFIEQRLSKAGYLNEDIEKVKGIEPYDAAEIGRSSFLKRASPAYAQKYSEAGINQKITKATLNYQKTIDEIFSSKKKAQEFAAKNPQWAAKPTAKTKAPSSKNVLSLFTKKKPTTESPKIASELDAKKTSFASSHINDALYGSKSRQVLIYEQPAYQSNAAEALKYSLLDKAATSTAVKTFQGFQAANLIQSSTKFLALSGFSFKRQASIPAHKPMITQAQKSLLTQKSNQMQFQRQNITQRQASVQIQSTIQLTNQTQKESQISLTAQIQTPVMRQEQMQKQQQIQTPQQKGFLFQQQKSFLTEDIYQNPPEKRKKKKEVMRKRKGKRGLSISLRIPKADWQSLTVGDAALFGKGRIATHPRPTRAVRSAFNRAYNPISMRFPTAEQFSRRRTL